jgi:hypothetical protein
LLPAPDPACALVHQPNDDDCPQCAPLQAFDDY